MDVPLWTCYWGQFSLLLKYEILEKLVTYIGSDLSLGLFIRKSKNANILKCFMFFSPILTLISNRYFFKYYATQNFCVSSNCKWNQSFKVFLHPWAELKRSSINNSEIKTKLLCISTSEQVLRTQLIVEFRRRHTFKFK